MSAAPARLVVSSRASTATPVRRAISLSLLMAALAASSASARCSLIKSTGSPPPIKVADSTAS